MIQIQQTSGFATLPTVVNLSRIATNSIVTGNIISSHGVVLILLAPKRFHWERISFGTKPSTMDDGFIARMLAVAMLWVLLKTALRGGTIWRGMSGHGIDMSSQKRERRRKQMIDCDLAFTGCRLRNTLPISDPALVIRFAPDVVGCHKWHCHYVSLANGERTSGLRPWDWYPIHQLMERIWLVDSDSWTHPLFFSFPFSFLVRDDLITINSVPNLANDPKIRKYSCSAISISN